MLPETLNPPTPPPPPFDWTTTPRDWSPSVWTAASALPVACNALPPVPPAPPRPTDRPPPKVALPAIEPEMLNPPAPPPPPRLWTSRPSDWSPEV